MLNGFDALLAAFANKQQKAQINKASISNMTAGFYASLWRATGAPAQGAIPAAAAQCTKALTGAISFTNPTAPDLLYLAKAQITAQNVGTNIVVMDRLAHMGGLVGNVATLQTVSLAPATTRANYNEMLWFVEIYTDIGTTATTLTVNYVDENDANKQITGLAIGATTNSQNRAARLIPVYPIDNVPIKSITSCQLTATTGTAGNFGFTVAVQKADMVTGGAYIMSEYDWAKLNIKQVKDDACLWIVVFCNTTTTGAVIGNVSLAAG